MKVLISIFILTLTNISFAEDMRYYDVEIIVIENLSDNAKNSENWPLQANLSPPEKTVQLGQPVPSDWLPQDKNIDLSASYMVLDASNYQLTSEVDKLSESTSQRIIFHTAWRQPGLDKHTALPITFKREIPAAPIMAETNHTMQYEENASEARSSVLEGLLRVTLARYLHLEAELVLREKQPDAVDTENPFAVLDSENGQNKIQKEGVVYLKQHRRRIRSNELHYLDHPVLGILVRITPYEKPEENITEATQKSN